MGIRPCFTCLSCEQTFLSGLDGVGREWVILWDKQDHVFLHFCKPCRDDMGIPDMDELGFGPGQASA